MNRFSPPIFLVIGLLLGGGFLVYVLTDNFEFGKGKTAHSKNVIELTEANWAKEVTNSNVPVLVDFWAPWCGPCVKLSPTIDRLAKKYEGRVKVGKVNIDNNDNLAGKYKIKSIPAVLLFQGDSPVDVMVGVNPESTYARRIDALLAK